MNTRLQQMSISENKINNSNKKEEKIIEMRIVYKSTINSVTRIIFTFITIFNVSN